MGIRAALARRLLPDERLPSVFDLDPKRLRALGIEGIVFDLDNTLGPWGFQRLDERTLRFLESLRQEGFRLGFLSNHEGDGREALLARLGGCPVLFNAGKPRRRGFQTILEMLDLPPTRVAMVGDQLFTDVLGAKRVGMYTVWVDPVAPDREDLSVRIRRFLERLLWNRLSPARTPRSGSDVASTSASASGSEAHREGEAHVQSGLVESREAHEER